ncbi:LysR family transcriptional regulator [Luteimonas huabeiensis]|uniref:LysR family transcriptional regulator n=1 Tax=Luteimonas huabeiensis TaxID=1244513 RepID=UPI001F1BDA6D|nr:LysR family transcriptional regulator [Luteimonas huabeiensis]
MKKDFRMKAAPLAALPLFELVARTGSFTRAADRLGISASAVSQGIRGLEQRLGVRLFHRSSRRLALSEAGQELLEAVGPSLERIDASLQQLQARRQGPSGLLRINLPRVVAETYVLPRLPDFVARYPEVQVELFTDDTFADLVRGGFDAGIRLGCKLAGDMVSLPIDRGQRRVVVASPAYLRAHGAPATPADLAGHDCIRFRLPGSGRLEPWRFDLDGRTVEVEVQGRLILSDDAFAREAACAGFGLSQRFADSVRAELADGRLVRVLTAFEHQGDAFHIYYPSRRQLPPKLRVFVAFLREGL